jgi:protein N-terminal methyltransferase
MFMWAKFHTWKFSLINRLTDHLTMSNPQPDSQIRAEKCKEYWETIDSDVNGMLGGVLSFMPSVSRIDLQGSRTFLARLGVGVKTGRQRIPRVLEGGAG